MKKVNLKYFKAHKLKFLSLERFSYILNNISNFWSLSKVVQSILNWNFLKHFPVSIYIHSHHRSNVNISLDVKIEAHLSFKCQQECSFNEFSVHSAVQLATDFRAISSITINVSQIKCHCSIQYENFTRDGHSRIFKIIFTFLKFK